MKISLVILVIFMAAAWANEEDEQDETELIEIEDPSYWKPKYCGYLNKCRPVKKCRTVLRFKTVCRNYCNTVKKCSKHHSKHDPYGYYPPKVYCKPVKTCRRVCHKVPVARKICRTVKKCTNVPKKCSHGYGRPLYRGRPYGRPYHGGKPYGYAPPPSKICYKSICKPVKKTTCKTVIGTRLQTICSLAYTHCGKYDYYGGKRCTRRVCRKISIPTPKAVCKTIMKKRCSRVRRKCPYY